jgi:threonine synthase
VPDRSDPDRSSFRDGTLAIGQRSLGDPDIGYPLWPPLTDGCPRTSTDDISYPVEVDYAYDRGSSTA